MAFLKASASALLMAPTLASGLATTFEKWDFESGTMFPHWQLTSTGPYSDRAWDDGQQEPDFAITNKLCSTGPEGSPGACTDGTALCDNVDSDPKAAAGECCGVGNPTFATHQSAPDCSPEEGGYFISSAVPWKDRNGNHGPLRVRSDPFVLGAGDVSFWMFGGIDCAQEHCPNPMAYTLTTGSGGVGQVTGVALCDAQTGERIAVATANNQHEWQQDVWLKAELSPHVGKVVTIDLYDTRGGNWGWFSADNFVIPVQESVGRMELRQALLTQQADYTREVDRLSLVKKELEGDLQQQQAALAELNKGPGTGSDSGKGAATAFAVIGWLLAAGLLATVVVLKRRQGVQLHFGFSAMGDGGGRALAQVPEARKTTHNSNALEPELNPATV